MDAPIEEVELDCGRHAHISGKPDIP